VRNDTKQKIKDYIRDFFGCICQANRIALDDPDAREVLKIHWTDATNTETMADVWQDSSRFMLSHNLSLLGA
jgi:hypothetical protein